MLTQKQHPHLLNADNTLLVVVDMQDSLLRAIHESERVLQNVCTLIRSAQIMHLPIFCTTQNRAKLGDLIPEVKSLLPAISPPFDKMAFSGYQVEAFVSEAQRTGRKQVLLCGVEAHICVSQTAHDMTFAGYQVHVSSDAISSRSEHNWRLGMDRMRQGGALLTSTEAALYELLQQAGTSDFREILKMVK